MPKRDAMAFLAASVAIDADHLPLALAPKHPEAGDPRPPTHSLLVPTLLAAAGQRAAALGVCAHYLRDLASPAGVPALAPLSGRVARVPYPVYAATVAALTLRAVRRDAARHSARFAFPAGISPTGRTATASAILDAGL